MNFSMSLRLIFLGISATLLMGFMRAGIPINFFELIIGGVLIGFILAADLLFNRVTLKTLNVSIFGLFLGYLLAQGIWLIIQPIAPLLLPRQEYYPLMQSCLYLCAIYFAILVISRTSEEFYISLPFVQLQPTKHKKKDLIVDSSVLLDSRILDLASCGLLDHHLIIPQFLLIEFQEMSECSDEALKTKGRKALEVIKKLESIPSLELRYAPMEFPEIKDTMAKLVRIARMLDANILTADNARLQQSTIEEIRIINIHSLSSALKPLAQTGEALSIKIQRYGKEPRQGVGYLEDGTMVVINGGAEYIGETIRAYVLSVKHTTSGRMIFCNASEDFSADPSLVDSLSPAKNYLAL